MKTRREISANIETPQEAIHATIHASLGPDGEVQAPKAIADRMGIPDWKIYQIAGGIDRKLWFEEAPRLILATGNPLILDVAAHAVGRVTFPLPQSMADFPELAGLTAQTARKYADFLGELAGSLADGYITRDEAKRLRAVGSELTATLWQAIAQVDANAEASAPRLRAAR